MNKTIYEAEFTKMVHDKMREANKFKEYERIPKNRIGGDYWNTYWTIRYMLRTIEYILANIVENTDISKYAIASNIRRCIAQHKNQKNYSQSVKCWTDDLKFIQKYKYGDLPEVLIGKIIVGKRE